jgi:hypothetical protein
MIAHPGENASYPELFDVLEEPFPQALNGELLYSWCARFHRLSGNSRTTTTSRMLFGHATIGLRHDFPGQLGYFEAATRGHLGSTQEIIQKRTQYALHAPFLDASTQQAVESVLHGNDRGLLNRHLGLSRSAQASLTPLKACPVCMAEDRKSIPSGWWHMDHQWATTYVCLKHGCLLRAKAKHLDTLRLQDWYLPCDLREDQWVAHPDLGRQQVDHLMHIARWGALLAQRRGAYFDPALLRHVYLYQAKNRGGMTMDGTLHFATLCAAFADSHRGLDTLPGWGFLNEVGTVHGGFLGLLLRMPPRRRHPLKYVLLMAFLYEEPMVFYAQYAEAKRILETEGVDALGRRLTGIQPLLIEMVGNGGKSVYAARHAPDISAIQDPKRQSKKDVAIHRRPRILSPALQAELDALLRAGAGRGEITKRLKVSKAYVKEYLGAQPELRAAWEQALKAEQMARYRARFLRVLEDNPGVPIQRIRRINGNGLEWLNRNDQEWLAENMPGIWRGPET